MITPVLLARQELDHAECVPNSAYELPFAQVGALSSGVCKTVG
jgi:hypothetical protein